MPHNRRRRVNAQASAPTPEEKFLAIANAKQAELEKFLKSKDTSFSSFKATIADEKVDVPLRGTYPYTGKIEFGVGVGKKAVDPNGKGSSQTICRFYAPYSYDKKNERWQWGGCTIVPNQLLPRRMSGLPLGKTLCGNCLKSWRLTVDCTNDYLLRAEQFAAADRAALPVFRVSSPSRRPGC